MNRQMLKLGFMALAFVVFAAPGWVNAQPGGGGFRGPGGPGGGPFGGGGMLGMVTRDEVQQELQLVDEQQEKVRDVAEEMQTRVRDELRDMFAQMQNLSDEERQQRFDEIRTRVESINADMEKKLKKVLLPHQFDRLKQISLQARLQQQGADALTSGEMADALNLTREQREKLEQRAAEVQQELQEKIAQLRLEARNKILEVLTAEQRAKLDSLMGDQFALPDQAPGFGGRGGRFGRGGGEGGRRSGRAVRIGQ